MKNKQSISLFLLTIILIFSAFFQIDADEVYSKNQKANNLYKKGKFEDALKLYNDALLLSPSDTKLKMNKGSTLYQTGQFDKAEELYNSALSADDKKTKADANYNIGNILFREGEQLQQSGNPSAKEKYQQALQHFIQTLDMRPNDTEAKWNLQLAHNRIKQVEQQQQQQQQQQNKNDKKDQKDNNQKQNQDQNKNSQDQNKKDQNQDNKQNQDQKDQNKNNQDQNKNQDDKQKQQQQQKEQQHQTTDQQKNDQNMKKDEARRLIELYADDADSLNKPTKKVNASHQAKPEQDW